MIARLKRQTKRRHSAGRVYHWTITASVVAVPVIGALHTPDIFAEQLKITGTPPSRRALRRNRLRA